MQAEAAWDKVTFKVAVLFKIDDTGLSEHKTPYHGAGTKLTGGLVKSKAVDSIRKGKSYVRI